MDAFERAGRGQRAGLRDAKQSRRFDEKQGPEPLAAAKDGVTHGLAEPGRPLALALGQQTVEPRLDGACHAFKLCEKGHLGESVKHRGSLPQNHR
jgi:hypothetical protein